MKFLEAHYKKIIFCVSLSFLAVSIINAKNDSATFDEVAHVAAGYSYVTEHDYRLNPEHPPLIKDLAALPLLFLNPKFDTDQDFWTGKINGHWSNGQWAAGRNLLYQEGNNPKQILFWSRLPIIILSALFGLFLFKLGKEYFGLAGGMLLFCLYSFDPNILGHNHYVTTDLGIAAFLTFSFYYFIKFLKNPSWINTAKAGFFLGLLLVTKFSSVIALPIYVLALILYVFSRKIRNSSGLEIHSFKKRIPVIGEYLGKSLALFFLSLVVIYSIYAINIYKMPQSVLSETVNYWFPTDDPNAKTFLNGKSLQFYTNHTLQYINKSEFARPMATYLFGPAWMLKRVVGGNTVYFLGEVGNGFVWYFPFVFLVKETIPFLMMLLISASYGFFQLVKRSVLSANEKHSFITHNLKRIRTYIHSHIATLSMLMFVLLYSFLSIKGGLNIGFRHLFPIMPFLFILITKKTADIYKNLSGHSRKPFIVAIMLFVFWMLVETVLAYPSYVSYFNESVGGPKNGYKYVTDSNADWGQDLGRLGKFLDSHPEIDRIRVDYFGGGDLFRILGKDKVILWWATKRPVENGWYAISTYFIQEGTYEKNKQPDKGYQWLSKYKPLYQIGTSIMVYKIDDIK